MSEELAQQTPTVNFRRLPRQRYSAKFKREAVEQTLHPGASLAAIALNLGLNSNVLWRWRREFEAGQLGGQESGSFIPVQLSVDPSPEASTLRPGTFGDRIEIHLGGARVVVQGRPDAIALRRVMEALR